MNDTKLENWAVKPAEFTASTPSGATAPPAPGQVHHPDGSVLHPELGVTAKPKAALRLKLPRFSLKHPLIISSFAMVLTALVSLGLLSQYSLRNVQLASLDVDHTIGSGNLRPALETAVQKYQLRLQYPDGTIQSWPLSEIGAEVDLNASIAAATAAQAGTNYLSRAMFWQSVTVPLVLNVDQNRYHEFVTAHATRVSKPAKNASLLVENGAARIESEVAGEGYKVPNTKTKLLKSMQHLSSQPLALRSSRLPAAISAAQLEPIKTQVDKVLSQDISFTIAGKSIKASASDIGNWLEFTPVEAEHTIDVTANGGKILEYINTIAEPFVQEPRNQVVMANADGSTQVLVAGRNGSDVHEKDKIAAALASQLLNGSGFQSQLPVTQAAYSTVNAQAYDKWILVDTGSKRLYAYEKSNLVKTFLVSAGAPETPTVQGEFKVYSKLRTHDMRGPNTDGSRYFAPNVPWVMYFHGGYAIHGNNWRPANYFGNINSSHGCVGLMVPDSEWMFNWAPMGTPVIVHS